jgi:predicted SprT family Zn-dependent metalloprotease
MPMKPRLFTYVCEECGWKKTVAPRSDAMTPGEWLDRCLKCGSKALKVETADWFASTKAEWLARCGRGLS